MTEEKPFKVRFLAKLLTLYFEFKRHFYYCKNINYPKNQCIFALWHAHQCGLYALEEREKTLMQLDDALLEGEMSGYTVMTKEELIKELEDKAILILQRTKSR